MKKLHVISLGCSKNLVDSEVMLGRLQDYEITQELCEADVIIINTCGFIEAAKQESLGHIFEALEGRKKGALLVASGCLVARYAKEMKEMIPEIDILTGVSDYNKIDAMIAEKRGMIRDEVYLQQDEKRIITGSQIHAYVKISEGCNQSCSFCAIPSFKGKLQSRSIDSVLREVEQLAKQGYHDISFIAQDTSSFLRDKGVNDGLLKLINAIEAQGAIKSARILYLYPSSTDRDLIDGIASSNIFQNYYDMPIQHSAKAVLAHMQRSAKDMMKLLEYMRAVPNSFVRSSIIAGYPTETESDFEELCAFLETFCFDRLNVFEYSHEEGTKAGVLEPIPRKIRTQRIRKIQKIIAKIEKQHHKAMLNTSIPCIIEGKSAVSPHFYSGRDMRWAKDIDGEILINDGEYSGAGYYNVHITQTQDNILVGRIVERI